MYNLNNRLVTNIKKMEIAGNLMSDYFKANRVQESNVHCVGFSLGAHACSMFYKAYFNKFGTKLGRITGYAFVRIKTRIKAGPSLIYTPEILFLFFYFIFYLTTFYDFLALTQRGHFSKRNQSTRKYILQMPILSISFIHRNNSVFQKKTVIWTFIQTVVQVL
jgi:hypothetical protein